MRHDKRAYAKYIITYRLRTSSPTKSLFEHVAGVPAEAKAVQEEISKPATTSEPVAAASGPVVRAEPESYQPPVQVEKPGFSKQGSSTSAEEPDVAATKQEDVPNQLPETETSYAASSNPDATPKSNTASLAAMFNKPTPSRQASMPNIIPKKSPQSASVGNAPPSFVKQASAIFTSVLKPVEKATSAPKIAHGERTERKHTEPSSDATPVVSKESIGATAEPHVNASAHVDAQAQETATLTDAVVHSATEEAVLAHTVDAADKAPATTTQSSESDNNLVDASSAEIPTSHAEARSSEDDKADVSKPAKRRQLFGSSKASNPYSSTAEDTASTPAHTADSAPVAAVEPSTLKAVATSLTTENQVNLAAQPVSAKASTRYAATRFLREFSDDEEKALTSARSAIRDQLRAENVQLWVAPYSAADGASTVSPDLVKRYAEQVRR